MKAWLVETMHYSYIGPNSFYRLTMHEIWEQQRGYNKYHEEDGGTGKGKSAGRRETDNSKLAAFKKRQNLE